MNYFLKKKKKKKKGEKEEEKESKEKTEDKTKTKQEYKEYKPFGSEAPKYSIKGIPDPEILKMRERIKEKIARFFLLAILKEFSFYLL